MLLAPTPVVESAPARRPAARPAVPKPPPREIEIILDGEERVAVGQLVTLDASETQADTFRWTLVGGGEGLYRVDTNGKIVYFSSGLPGDYVFVLSVAKSTDDGPLLEVQEHVVSVEGSNPPPPNIPPAQPPAGPPVQPPVQPPAQPPVSPADPLPEGRYGLARFCRDTAMEVVPSGPKRHEPATALSVAYVTIAQKIESGQLADPAAIVKAQQMVNSMVLTQVGAGNSWNVFFNRLAERLKTLGLTTARDHADAWREISLGLGAVK